jgi:hypothetical protein
VGLVVALLIPAAAGGQTIRGIVVSDDGAATGAAVSALAPMRDTVIATSIAEDGSFTIIFRRPGTYRLRAQLLGYATTTTEPVTLASDEIVHVELRLRADAIPLEPLRVVARRMEPWFMSEVRRREREGFGRFLWREDLEPRAGSQLRDVLWTVPGLRVPLVEVADGEFVPVVETRSAAHFIGTCHAALYVDGIRQFYNRPTIAGADKERLEDFFAIPPADIETIEVYRGAAEVPAEYSGSTAECGVVAVWLRRGESFITVGEDQPRLVGPTPRVRLTLGAGTYEFTGKHSPERAKVVEASAYWRIDRALSIGLHMRHGAPRLPLQAVAELTSGLADSFVIPAERHPSTLFIAGVGPRLRLLPRWIAGPVLSGRFQVTRRQFRLDRLRTDRATSFTSWGWGASASAGIEVRLTNRLRAQAAVAREWLSFGTFATLETRSRQTAADWNGTGLRFGIGYEL